MPISILIAEDQRVTTDNFSFNSVCFITLAAGMEKRYVEFTIRT